MRIFLPIVLISAIIITTSPAQAEEDGPVAAPIGINIPPGPLASSVDTINKCFGLLLFGRTVSDEPQRRPVFSLTENDMISTNADTAIESEVAAAAVAVCVENT